MLGETIKSYLDDNGLKYSHVANEADISIPIFSAILNGKRGIKAEEYFAICAVLNVSRDYFCPWKSTA